MSVWTRMASWLGYGQQRAAQIDPLVAALTQRYAGYGMPVSPESAARKVAVGSTIRLITNTGRTMPVHAYRGTGGATEELPTPAILEDPDGTGRGIDDFIAQALWSLAARGNLMVHVLTVNGSGRPETIEVLNPDLVHPEVDGDGALWWKPMSGPRIPGRRVKHVRLFPVPGVVMGLSPIEQHAATIGAGIAAEKFGSDFFDAGGHPTALLKSAAPLSQSQSDRVKSKFRIAAASREPVLLPDGIEYEQIQVKPNESQFLDAQEYSSAECCRIFGPGFAEALGYETGGTYTYTNAVDSDVKLLKYSLDAYLTPIDRVLTWCLPKLHYVKLGRESLLRMNPLDRFRLYEIGSRIGIDTPNDQLALEDRPPVPWGDKPYVVKKTSDTTSSSQNGAPQ
ncbi:phage portal protein [Paractinoplanes atraurantiacus]|uniref:Phage portal protein, HK97 family n=1 Tax=Paractinoplanes atraurantiacus TaxID=1036182 RepID=A0A285GZQ3_9ACTN|nr:phage portal protein [Actinoplanes atraurantiacus]SNY29002.1 phage portal protein, HK97 family [Actinoplanes atraurantiacus]